MHRSLEPRVLHLPAEAASAPKARHFVGRSLAESDYEPARDTAELCVSELVTNAVLHAGTDLDVGLAPVEAGIRLWVDDLAPGTPRTSSHSRSSATGRGLSLVAAMARCWGVERREPRGKSVWCEIDSRPDHDPDRAAGPARQVSAAPAEPGGVDAGSVVVLRGYPVILGMREAEHYASLLRECQLIHVAGSTDNPARLVALAELILESHGSSMADLERSRRAALARGQATIDLTYPLDPASLPTFEAFRESLTEMDRYSADGRLLTAARAPEVTRLLDWVVEENVRQARGADPTPWDGPLR